MSFMGRNGVILCTLKVKLGQELSGKMGKLRVIRSTGKGINFLIVARNKVLFRRAFYARKWAGKEIPEDQNYFNIIVPMNILPLIGL